MEIIAPQRVETLADFLTMATPVFDILPDAIRVVDLEGNAHYFNRAFLQMTGFSPSEIMNKNLDDIYLEEDRPRVRTAFQTVKKTGSTVGTVEARIKRKGGDPLVVSLKAMLIRNAANEPIGAYAIFRDVTRMDRILSEPLELLNLTGSPVDVLRELPVRLASYYPGRPWVMINLVEGDYLRFAYAVNVPPELMALGGERLDGSICAIPISTGQPLPIGDMTEDERVRHDPCVTQYGCRGYLGYPIIHSSGRILGTICVLRTNRGGFSEYDHRLLEMMARRASIELERLELEAKLQESEKDLDDLIKSAPLMIWRMDGEGRLQVISQKGREDLGFQGNEKIRDTLYDRVHPDDVRLIRSVTAGFTTGKNGGKGGSVRIRIRKRDNSYGAFFLSIRPIYDSSDRLKLIEGIGFEIPGES